MKERISNSRGFTLLELVIAIAVVGIVSVVIFALFDTTSQNFLEVDQLASLNDRARFAVENVRGQVQAAGALSSPDDKLDDFVAPALPTTSRVAGLYPYPGWQNNTSVLPTDIQTANPNVSFDGIIIAGAYDFPLAFEFAGMNLTGTDRFGRIYSNYRGLGKLLRQDPFSNANTVPTTTESRLNRNWTTRLVRVSDRQGYQQFVQPRLDLAFLQDVQLRDYLQVPLPPAGNPFAPKFKGTGELFGIDDLPEGDTGYDAGLIDFFWLHVVPDEANPNVMTLVRDRLCGAAVVSAGVALNPANLLATNAACPSGILERVVLASYVADFQVWFDCADPVDGAIRNAVWSNTWVSKNAELDPTDCMNSGTPRPGLARVAHIRLAMHTQAERRDQEHMQFEDALGPVCPGGVCNAGRLPLATLRTYDFAPKSRGAARVIIMQSDFELVNFVNRNPL